MIMTRIKNQDRPTEEMEDKFLQIQEQLQKIMENMVSMNDRNVQTDKALMEIKQTISCMKQKEKESEACRAESSVGGDRQLSSGRKFQVGGDGRRTTDSRIQKRNFRWGLMELVIAVLVGGISILAGHITAEQLTKFVLYSEWLIYSTWWVGDNFSSLMQSIGASEKVFQLMDLGPSDKFIDKGSKLERLAGHIEFVNVSFYYPSRVKVPVLQHINFVVHPGEVVALVGLSGSGKSTLVNLLLQLYEPISGQIFIDGCPIRDLNIKWLRERIGYVGQEPRLFRMDIGSNIRYGCSRDVNQQDVEWAAKEAAAHDFISSLPNGYHTIVDNDLLSGGQKQRIAIARAILRDPDILVLDEATSALDAESEHNIKGVLRAVRKELNSKRTVIVIAHRLSTIQAADRIVVMESGKIVEMGSHQELLLKDGLYARLTRRQADAVA